MTRYVAGTLEPALSAERLAQYAAVLRTMARSCDASAEQVARQVGELREAKIVIGSSWGGLRRDAAIHRSRDYRREVRGAPEQFAIAAAILRDWARNADALADLLPRDADESVDVIGLRDDVSWRWTVACNAATANLSPVIRQLATVSAVEIRRAPHVDQPYRRGWRALQSRIDGLERWISRNPDETVSYWWRRRPQIIAVPFVQHGPRRVAFRRAPLSTLTLSAASTASFASSPASRRLRHRGAAWRAAPGLAGAEPALGDRPAGRRRTTITRVVAAVSTTGGARRGS
jgi:hypothetical protein